MVTFAEISPSRLRAQYEYGMSISEIARSIARSYSFTRNRLLERGTTLREKSVGTRLYIDRHPSWADKFVKYRVAKYGKITNQKILLLTMIVTEGYFDRRSFGFTNSQPELHAAFKRMVTDAYGDVRIGRNGLLSRVSSTEIARDIKQLLPNKTFGDPILDRLSLSDKLTARVLRIIADTEGSMIISPKRAPRNYTVESRVVLASTNRKFSKQIWSLLASLRINSNMSVVGVQIMRKDDIRRFIDLVGFTRGIRVVRKHGTQSSWYHFDKHGLSRLFLRICGEQRRARKSGSRGCFADCRTREQTMSKLTRWYREENGGGPVHW